MRKEHLAASGLTDVDVLRVIESLEDLAEPVMVLRQPRPLSLDQDDDMILDIAINGNADAIVTHNIKHFEDAGRRFSLPVVTPAELLKEIGRR